MRKKLEWEWEILDEWSKRAKVIGGWLVHTTLQDKSRLSCCMEFVSDRDHDWLILERKVIEEKKCPIEEMTTGRVRDE